MFYSNPARFAMAGAAFLCFGLAGTAGAASLFGVSVSANAVANDGCAVSGSYSTSGGLSGPTVSNFGTGPSIEGFVNCSTTFLSPTATGATTASLQANAQDTKPADSFVHAGTANTTADLSTGTLHGFSSSGGNASFQGTGQGTTDAKFWDQLTFSIPGATGTTVTNIPVFLSADGTGNDQTQQEWGVFLQFGEHGCIFNGCGIGVDQVNWGWNPNNGPVVFSAASGNISFNSDPFQNSINWQTPSVNTINNLRIEGILSLTGPTAVVDISAELSTLANGGTVDFGHTAGISFQLPAGVTSSSASGVFGTATVPEPAAAGLCGFGLALLPLVVGRRRRKT